MTQQFNPLDPLGIIEAVFAPPESNPEHCFGEVRVDPSLQPGGSLTGMTGQEIITALLQGRPVSREPFPEEVQEAEEVCQEIRNPDLHWDPIIQRFEQSLLAARRSKARKDVTPFIEKFGGDTVRRLQ